MSNYKNELEELLNLKKSINRYKHFDTEGPSDDLYKNRYFYARNFDKGMDENFDKSVAELGEILPLHADLIKEEHSLQNKLTEEYDIKTESIMNTVEKETYYLKYIDGVLVYSTKEEVQRPILINKKDINVLEQINALQSKTDVKTKKVEKLLAKNPNVSHYIKANNAFDKYEKYLFEISNLPRQKEYDSIHEQYMERINILDEICENYAKGLKIKKYEIALGVLFIKNFNELSLSEIGAVAQFAKDTKTDKHNYSEYLEKLIQKVEVASLLHEEWRKGRFDDKTGKYEPRWKEVKDMNYKCPNENFAKTENGKSYIDIANLAFNDLSFDWQLENFEAAEIATELSKVDYKLGEIGMVGNKIHHEWLKRNEYAKGTELGKNFAELCVEERLKDLVQYFISIESIKKDSLISTQLNRKNFSKQFTL